MRSIQGLKLFDKIHGKNPSSFAPIDGIMRCEFGLFINLLKLGLSLWYTSSLTLTKLCVKFENLIKLLIA